MFAAENKPILMKFGGKQGRLLGGYGVFGPQGFMILVFFL